MSIHHPKCLGAGLVHVPCCTYLEPGHDGPPTTPNMVFSLWVPDPDRLQEAARTDKELPGATPVYTVYTRL